jgi:hypothetical protein
MHTANQSRVRSSLVVVALLAFAALAFGLHMLGPDLLRDLGRLHPWQLVLVLLAEAVALFWFLVFITRHCFLGRPLLASNDPDESDRSFGPALFTLFAALLVDLSVTIFLQIDDHHRFAAARVVDGECHALQARHRQRAVGYDLECRFIDKAGNKHEASFYVGGIRDNRNDDIEPDLLRALLREQVPFDVKISYDPDRPTRVWLTGLAGRYHGWNVHVLSNLFVFMQLLGLLIFLALVANYRHKRGHNPCWLDLHKAFPLLIQAAGLALMGIAELIRR